MRPSVGVWVVQTDRSTIANPELLNDVGRHMASAVSTMLPYIRCAIVLASVLVLL